jgi:hypothetical protein
MRGKRILVVGKLWQDVNEDIRDRDPARCRQPYIAPRRSPERYRAPKQMDTGKYQRGDKGEDEVLRRRCRNARRRGA